MSLLTAAVKTLAGEGVPPYAFTVVSPAQNAKAYMLQADSEGEQRQWMAAIQVLVCTRCLSQCALSMLDQSSLTSV